MEQKLDGQVFWQPEFATGIQVIDDQHRVLIAMLNEANMKINDHSPSSELDLIVQGLLNYAGYHFGTEERFAADSGYFDKQPEEASAHLAQHHAFADRVTQIKQELGSGQRISKADLVAFLKSWLINHILNTDMKLGAYLRTATG
ncbi:bacteriohemerythrin [Propionivibrio dicarboxylicus]|nr:bacteriohemerythrin [Propionivibrio dicarboxylicus]